MGSRRLLFRAFYRLGFVPWDGHSLATNLIDLIVDYGVPGIDPSEVARRFEGPWTLQTSAGFQRAS